MSVFFNGRLFTTPIVASQIDDSEMANKNLTVPLNLAIVGKADSGEPNLVVKFSNAIDAQRVFKGGELLKAIEKAFAPSSETNGPQAVYAVRVNPATQAHLVVDDGTEAVAGALQALSVEDDELYTVKLAAEASATDGVYSGYKIVMTSGNARGETNLIEGYTGASKLASLRYPWHDAPDVGDTYDISPAALAFVSDDYGDNANMIRVKVQSGTTSGKKLYTSFGSDQVIADNIGATYIGVKYDGVEASALMSITASELTVSAGDLGAENPLYSFLLSEYDTVEKLADALDAKPDLTADIASSFFAVYPTLGTLDFVADVQIASAESTGITANLQALVNFVNSVAEPYVTAYRPPSAGKIPANFDWAYLFGGDTGVATTTEWQAGINLLQAEDVQCVVPLTSDASVHAMAQSHCQYMSNSAGMERRAIVGGALGESSAEVIARAYALNDDRLYIITPGIKDYDSSGNLITYAPYMAAAIAGGMITGCDPGTSLTNKTPTIYGLEKRYINPADTDDLINAGVMAIVATKKGYKIIKSVSTWLSNDNYNRVEMGTGFATDYVARNVREALQTLIGAKGTSTLLARAVSITENTLKELARPAPLGPEVITGDEDSPAYKNITATLEGDVLRVYFQCSPVIPVNYVLVGISIVPYSGSATSY